MEVGMFHAGPPNRGRVCAICLKVLAKTGLALLKTRKDFRDFKMGYCAHCAQDAQSAIYGTCQSSVVSGQLLGTGNSQDMGNTLGSGHR
jgi:hypothetical protein